MKIVTSIAKMQELSLQTRSVGLRLAFVPTMGFLHEGHLELVRRARQIADVVVVSIFVNPTQFDDKNDLEAYPRDEDRDARLLRTEGVNILFMPDAADVYPDGAATSVSVAGLTERLCGAHRTGHFSGVTTVVSALFNMVYPDIAVFGEKDYQQLQTIRRMTRDMHFPIAIEAVPTVREHDGLALSSRNARLSDEQREKAPAIYRSLQAAASAYADGERDAKALLDIARDGLSVCEGLDLEYLEAVEGNSLEAIERAEDSTVIAVAARLGDIRLIDNVVLGDQARTEASQDEASGGVDVAGAYEQEKGVRANA